MSGRKYYLKTLPLRPNTNRVGVWGLSLTVRADLSLYRDGGPIKTPKTLFLSRAPGLDVAWRRLLRGCTNFHPYHGRLDDESRHQSGQNRSKIQ